MNTLALRFIRWGTGLLVLGLLTGYGPLFHYLSGGVRMTCPWAPAHAHVVLLGWVGFTIFGLVYRALPDWGIPTAAAIRVAGAHFWVSVISVLGVYTNGIFGYRLLDRISPSFYYKPDMKTLRLWLSIDGFFLTLFAVGCILFMMVVFSGTKKEAELAKEASTLGR